MAGPWELRIGRDNDIVRTRAGAVKPASLHGRAAPDNLGRSVWSGRVFAGPIMLLSINGGEIWFCHPQPFVMSTALDKTVQEFKMWQAMTRQPGQPAEYLATVYEQALLRQRMIAGGGNERLPEVSSERLWEAVV